jgi:hypothetical protein
MTEIILFWQALKSIYIHSLHSEVKQAAAALAATVTTPSSFSIIIIIIILCY